MSGHLSTPTLKMLSGHKMHCLVELDAVNKRIARRSAGLFRITHGETLLDYSALQRLKTSEPLVPPNPKLLEIA